MCHNRFSLLILYSQVHSKKNNSNNNDTENVSSAYLIGKNDEQYKQKKTKQKNRKKRVHRNTRGRVCSKAVSDTSLRNAQREDVLLLLERRIENQVSNIPYVMFVVVFSTFIPFWFQSSGPRRLFLVATATLLRENWRFRSHQFNVYAIGCWRLCSSEQFFFFFCCW